MSKIAIIILSDTNTIEAMGKVSNAFMMASEAIEMGDELKIIFEGAGSKWISQLETEDHRLHTLYKEIKEHVTGVCSYCAQVFGATKQVENAGLKLISEYKQHPSLRQLVHDGFEVITF